MRDYLKILASVIAALLSMAALIVVVIAVVIFVSADSLSAEPILFPFVIALAGFMMFGISGSIVWFVTYRALGQRPVSPMGRHAIGASCGVLASVTFEVVTFSSHGGIKLTDFLVPLALVVPVVAVSLLWHWALFIRRGPKRLEAQ